MKRRVSIDSAPVVRRLCGGRGAKAALWAVLLVLCSVPSVLLAEDGAEEDSGSSGKSLPNGYGGVTLGMSMDDTKDALKKHGEFGYHGDRDVSLLPGENRALIETSARRGHTRGFLTNCYFQFYNDKLYIITINLNREKIDHYSVFRTLCDKYGKPDSLDPEKSTWKSGDVTMSLERPLALKYIDNEAFEDLNGKSSVEPTGMEVTQDMFLKGL